MSRKFVIIYKVDGERLQGQQTAIYCRNEEGTEINHLQTKKIH